MTMMRRGFLAGAGAGLGYAVLDGDPARAQPKPVWRHYAQEELDRNYDQSAWAPNMRQLITRYDLQLSTSCSSEAGRSDHWGDEAVRVADAEILERLRSAK